MVCTRCRASRRSSGGMPRALRFVHSSLPAKPGFADAVGITLVQELVSFPRPELPQHLSEALLRASQESECIPEPVPNPSLPEHMKPRPNQLKSKQGRQKMPLHRCEVPTAGGDVRADSPTRQVLLESGPEYRLAARSARLQRAIHSFALEHQATARPRSHDGRAGHPRVQAGAQVAPHRPLDSGRQAHRVLASSSASLTVTAASRPSSTAST